MAAMAAMARVVCLLVLKMTHEWRWRLQTAATAFAATMVEGSAPTVAQRQVFHCDAPTRRVGQKGAAAAAARQSSHRLHNELRRS